MVIEMKRCIFISLKMIFGILPFIKKFQLQ